MNVETFGSPKLRLLEIIGALNNNRALLVDCGKPCTFFLWGLGDWGVRSLYKYSDVYITIRSKTVI